MRHFNLTYNFSDSCSSSTILDILNLFEILSLEDSFRIVADDFTFEVKVTSSSLSCENDEFMIDVVNGESFFFVDAFSMEEFLSLAYNHLYNILEYCHGDITISSTVDGKTYDFIIKNLKRGMKDV